MTGGLSRRRFLGAAAGVGGLGALTLAFPFGGIGSALAQSLPSSLRRTARLDAWLRIEASGRVTVMTGKVELGQGLETAIAQIAAEELDVAMERMSVLTADTATTPDEGYTAGSMSIEQSGLAVRFAAAEARHVLLEEAARRHGVAAGELRVEDGRVLAARPDGDQVLATYWELVAGRTLEREATGTVAPKSPSRYTVVGRSVPRLDLPAKIFGEESFVQDLRLPGMLHARVVRPPHYGARLDDVDAGPTRALPGVVAVVRDGSFLAVVAEREEQAIAAATMLAHACRWRDSRAGTELPDRNDLASALQSMDARSTVIHETPAGASGAATRPGPGERELRATYLKPYLAHASIAPSCAVAEASGDRLTVWTHSQGVFPLREALAKVLGMPAEKIRVQHREGAGCYGHNGADDVALDAALVARAIEDRPVRVQWSREDEFCWEPFGSAQVVRLTGRVGAAGRVADFTGELWSCTHSTRPGRQATLLAAWHRERPEPPAVAVNIPLPAGGMDRNAVPPYGFARQRVVEHFLPDMPVRVSALRSLGAFANVFAIESFVDEMARAAEIDPLAFRLAHLDDPRARAVLEAVAESSAWSAPGSAGRHADDGLARGRGLAFTRYKNRGSYLALVVAVAVDRASGQIRVERAWGAVDAGLVVNPDGVRNQIQGGVVQATSWTLREEVTFDRRQITSRDWRTYPILDFSAAPEVEVTLIDRPQEPSVGVGETAQGPTPAAIANAVHDAVGIRLRELPLSPERVLSALRAVPSAGGEAR